MKQLIILAPLLLIGAACHRTTTGSSQDHLSATVSVVVDITDRHELKPQANALLQLYQSEKYLDAASAFRLRAISDRMLTPISSVHLPAGEVTAQHNEGDDPQFRRKNIAAFQKRVRQLLSDFYETTDTSRSLDNSECIRTIAEELYHLVRDQHVRKYLVVFSDLNEKSDLCDVYKNTEDAGGIVERALSMNGTIPDRLDGITLFFVFSPANREKDIQYRRIAGAYKKILEQRGGKVVIQATSDVFEP
jgi:hypothetical protein